MRRGDVGGVMWEVVMWEGVMWEGVTWEGVRVDEVKSGKRGGVRSVGGGDCEEVICENL